MRYFPLVFLMLAAGWLLGACSATAPVATGPANVVKSDDGQAQLTIPAGALPQGVKPSDIHITKLLPNPQTPITVTDLPLANYRMEPNGLVFQMPITFSEVITDSSSSVPMLILGSATSGEVLSNVNVAMDPATNQTELSAPIQHFSDIETLRGLVVVRMSEPGWLAVGQTFSETVTWASRPTYEIASTTDENGYAKVETYNIHTANYSGPALMELYASYPFTVTAGQFSATNVVTPQHIDDAPTQLSADSSAFYARTFQCTRVGEGSISHAAEIRMPIVKEYHAVPAGFGQWDQTAIVAALQGAAVDSTRFVGESVYIISVKVHCGLPSPTPSPNGAIDLTATYSALHYPSATPTLTPTPTPSPGPLPIVQSFVAAFVQAERATHYTVTAVDPAGGVLKYAWTKVQPPGLACGLFGPTDQASTVWQHADAPIGHCPNEPVHLATITVVISNANGSVTCEYHGGSADGTVAQCVNSR